MRKDKGKHIIKEFHKGRSDTLTYPTSWGFLGKEVSRRQVSVPDYSKDRKEKDKKEEEKGI